MCQSNHIPEIMINSVIEQENIIVLENQDIIVELPVSKAEESKKLQSQTSKKEGSASKDDKTKKTLSCLECKKVFGKTFDLEMHMRSHSGLYVI